nr:MAG: DNA pilot protein [Microviridae sp.]
MNDVGTASVIAGAIPVVGGLVSGLINNSQNSDINQQNEEFQLQQQQSQEEYNTKMWQMQNDYNSPSNQMARLQAAGINPNLAYGGSASNNVAAAPAVAPQAHYTATPAPPINGAEIGASAVNAFNNTQLGVSQTNNLQADTTNKLADTILKDAQTYKTNAEGDTIFPMQRANIDYLDSQSHRNNIEANTNSMLAPFQASMFKANVQKTVNDMALQNAQAKQLMQDTISKQMDNSQRQNGIMPNDSLLMRILGKAYRTIQVNQNPFSQPLTQ